MCGQASLRNYEYVPFEKSIVVFASPINFMYEKFRAWYLNYVKWYIMFEFEYVFKSFIDILLLLQIYTAEMHEK